MPKFAIPAPEPEHSQPSQRLAELQLQLDEAQARVDEQHALAARLDDIHRAVAPARAALAQYDAQNAAGFAAWARGDVTGKPTTDAARRGELSAELDNALAASASATVAQEQFRRAAVAESAPLPRLQIEIDEARRLVILDDAFKLFSPIADAIATAVRLHNDLDAARNAALIGVEFGAGRFLELGAALAAFDAAREKAEARPVEPAPEIRTNPGAQIAAEMRAAMSFPSVSTVR
jgi:hypothetical protein